MKKTLAVLSLAGLAIGCAHIKVDAPKEPIKLDVSMRLDIYQHIQNDIDSIEDMVSGGKKAKVGDQHSLLNLLVNDVYADDGLPAEVQAAALRRKERRDALAVLESRGSVGEAKDGMAAVRKSVDNAQDIVGAENADRRLIYQAVAQKNGSSMDEVAGLYAKRLQSDAPAGTPIETDNGWQIK